LSGVSLSHLFDRFCDEISQDASVDIVELLDVQASLSGRVFAELGHQCFVVQAWAQIQSQVLLTRREAGQQAVPFAAAFVFVVILAETDDARAPHFRRLPRDVLHELDEFMAVFAFLFIVHLFDECGRNPLKRQLSNGCCALFNGLGATTK